MDAENYYQILGVDQDADDEAVKQAFREKAKNYHPDRNPGNAEAELRFKLIGTAYDALKDSARRESYNQYLAFNEGREKSERRQWGRLFAVIALLLVGPSVAFAAVYALGGMALFSGGTEVTQTVAPVQPQAESRPIPPSISLDPPPPLKPLANARQEPEAPARTALNTPPAPSLAPQPQPEPTPAPVPSAPPPAPAPQTTAPPPSLVPPTAALPQPIAPLPAPSPAAEEPSFEENRTATPAPLPEDTPPAPAPVIDPFEGPEPEPRQQAAPATTESDARASARLLSQLKEPDRPAPDADAGNSTGGQVAALPREERRKDTFADCPTCPVMSTRTAVDLPGEADTAVSLAEITVGEWNACVRDGVCSPYNRGAAPETPVIGISRRNATAYADWLSARTGETYRIVVTPPQARAPAQQARNCPPDNRGGVTGFEWLEDDRPRTPCPPGATANGEDRPAGFRVARKLRRQG